jgi:hypothetical protein
MLLSVIPFCLFGQNPNPGMGRVFTNMEVPKVYINVDEDSLAALYDQSNNNWYSNHEYPADFVWQDALGSDTLLSIGIRFRGNTSRGKAKKAFKVSFNTFVPSRRFEGLKKLNLNAETNDPSMMRSYAGWKLFRDYGVAASRSNHVELYINGNYYGLYQNCEHINDDWVESRFGDDAGNLYKCTYPASLDDQGTNPEAYKGSPEWSDTRVYDLKTNEEVDDYKNLAAFVSFLNNAANSDFICQFPEYFNVYSYLKVAAIDVLIGNWDGYIWNVNNYYLYDQPYSGRFEYLPYDLDNSWGVSWPQIDWSQRDLYNYGNDNFERILYDRMMESQAFRDIFSWHLRQLLEVYFYSDVQQSHLIDIHGLISASALVDPYRSLDFGYSEADFLNALNEAFGEHVWYGLFPFAGARSNAALAQVEQNEIAPIISDYRENFSDFPQMLRVNVKTDGPEWSTMSLNYTLDGIEQTALVSSSGESEVTFDIVLGDGVNELLYNITVTGSNGLNRSAFCAPRKLLYDATTPRIVINEVMASNATTIADEYGEFDDWIELHNASATAINLTDYYLVDKNASPKYWALPPVTMEAGQFLLVWADGSPEQGSRHSNYSVGADGEGIYLFRQLNDGIHVVDLVQVPASQVDVSYGRASDASLPWIFFDESTPESSNEALGVAGASRADELRPFPNPSQSSVRWPGSSTFTLCDLRGKLLDQGFGNEIDMSALAKGMYLLKLDSGMHRILKQ